MNAQGFKFEITKTTTGISIDGPTVNAKEIRITCPDGYEFTASVHNNSHDADGNRFYTVCPSKSDYDHIDVDDVTGEKFTVYFS